MPIATVNPATGKTVKTFAELGERELEAKLAAAASAAPRQRALSMEKRSSLMQRAADALEHDKRRYAELATLEMGKPIKQAVAEIEKCAWACRFFAEHAAEFLADEHIATDGLDSLIRYEPLGIVLAIMPWNFPYWQVFRFAAPALMAGNVGLLKHASNVPQCALAIEEVFQRAGFAPGTFQTLLIGSSKVNAVIRDARVRAVTLTGSEAAGRSVASEAGHEIKKTVLELGGSDPFIVMPSADLEQAASIATQARVQNNGQSCIAAKRFIVAEPIAERFQQIVVERFKALKVDDPMKEETDVGPLVNESGLAGIQQQVENLVAHGAKVLTGGKRLDRPGYYYEPTIISNVDPQAEAAKEEIFGPVALIFRARDVDAAIALANSTTFGLGAAVFTNDVAEQQKFVNDLEAGAVFVNGMVKSDPRLPFGGVKASGYGRELSLVGIHEFVNIKTVWIGPSKQAQPVRAPSE